MNKHSMFRYLILVVILILVAGCAKPTPTPVPAKPVATKPVAAPTAEPTAPQTQGPVTLSFVGPAVGPNPEGVMDAWLSPAKEKYPWITVEALHVPPPDVATKLDTSLAGGSPPDFALMETGEYIKFAQAGRLLDLTPLAEADGFDWRTYFNPSFYEPLLVDGKLYGLMDITNSGAMAYNKSMFDDAGIPYPDESWTWDDIVTVGKQLTKKDAEGNTIQWGFLDVEGNYHMWIWMNGGRRFNDDYTECLMGQPETVEALQWLADLRFKHGIMPTREELAAYQNPQNMFAGGHVAMIIAGWIPHATFFFPNMVKDFEWDVAPIPKNPRTGIRHYTVGGWGLACFADSEHPEETYKVWRTMVSDEGGYGRWVEGNGIPVLPSGPTEKWPLLTKAMGEVAQPEHFQVYIDSVKELRPYYIPRTDSRDIFNAMSPYFDELWMGMRTAAEIAPEMVEAVNVVLTK